LAFSKTVVQRSNIDSAVNIACIFKCYVSKSKLVPSECNDLCFIAKAFIAFTLIHEMNSDQFFPDTRYIHIGYFEATRGICDLFTEVRSAEVPQNNIITYLFFTLRGRVNESE
jgi:hypothetical protein